MQFILDIIAAALVWLAAVAFGHFGIKVDLPDRHPPKAERIIERTPAPARQSARTNPDCPELKPAALKTV
ncbi:hypothetical protein QO010_000075 [Caulobacter ginsengisoli]|uniref:Uncharacterized protein n=1 Tax=Caulobacter ginsengisoli TaxID=400775 RepID=A0ABU0IJZ0_9CAUL|nr:hypothetical protein [Caulobacter ginsengisoli]MDQ0462327.1 hypothetical protein [Caulobacter ginsengisoli]